MQLPYYYSTPLTAIYPLLPTTDFQTLSPVAQQLALLQGQQPKPQQVSAATLPTLPLTSQTLASLQLQQQLAAQQQQAAVLQSQLYGSVTAGTSPPLTNQTLTSLQLQQQAALLSALAAQQVTPQVATPNVALATESRKRTARAVGFEDSGSEEKKSAPAASTTSAPSVITSSSSSADYTSLQQLLLLNAANSNVSNGLPTGKRHLDKNGLPANGHAIPIYAAQQPTGPQFGPYIGYAPVSYSGQLPPRF